MKNYIISYDLHDQRHYQPVWDLLNRIGAVRLLESLWMVTTAHGSAQLRDALRATADNDDSFVVIELIAGAEWSAWSAKSAGANWLTANVRRY